MQRPQRVSTHQRLLRTSCLLQHDVRPPIDEGIQLRIMLLDAFQVSAGNFYRRNRP